MKHIYYLATLLLLTLGLRTLAQTDTAQASVKWQFSAKKGADGNPVLVLHATIQNGWKLYSTTNPDTVGYSRVQLDSTVHATITGIEEKGISNTRRIRSSTALRPISLPARSTTWSISGPAQPLAPKAPTAT
jgi:hypothetical protein